MSEESIQRICDRFAQETDRACAEGRGKEHMHEYFRALAADWASTVFLACDQAATRNAPMTETQAEVFLEWLQEFVEQMGVSLVDSVKTTMAAFHASAEMTESAEMATATAYQDQLDKLFGATRQGQGGSA